MSGKLSALFTSKGKKKLQSETGFTVYYTVGGADFSKKLKSRKTEW
jgi:hypothetical protein